MDKQNIGELNILQEIQSNGNCTQRELAQRSGLTLSYLNIYLKGLVRKGYVSVRDMPGRRLWYNLTPIGIAEKAKMTLEYMKWLLANYQDRLSGIKTGKSIKFSHLWCFGCRRNLLYRYHRVWSQCSGCCG